MNFHSKVYCQIFMLTANNLHIVVKTKICPLSSYVKNQICKIWVSSTRNVDKVSQQVHYSVFSLTKTFAVYFVSLDSESDKAKISKKCVNMHTETLSDTDVQKVQSYYNCKNSIYEHVHNKMFMNLFNCPSYICYLLDRCWIHWKNGMERLSQNCYEEPRHGDTNGTNC